MQKELTIGKYHVSRVGNDLMIKAGDVYWAIPEEEFLKMLELGIEIGLNNKINEGTKDE